MAGQRKINLDHENHPQSILLRVTRTLLAAKHSFCFPGNSATILQYNILKGENRLASGVCSSTNSFAVFKVGLSQCPSNYLYDEQSLIANYQTLK